MFMCVCFIQGRMKVLCKTPRSPPSPTTTTTHKRSSFGLFEPTMHDLLWEPFKQAEQLTFFGSVFLHGIPSMEKVTRQTPGLNVSTLARILGQALIKHE